MGPDGDPGYEAAGGSAAAQTYHDTSTSTTADGVGSAHWLEVRTAAGQVARDRLNVLTFAVQTGVRNFQRDADSLVDDLIKEPPAHPISGLGALVEGFAAACDILIPEAGVAHEIYLTAKTFRETIKPARELVDHANEAVAARSVEEAKSHLKGLTRDLADDADNRAPRALAAALATVDESLELYMRMYPDSLQDSHQYYGALCDGIGIHEASTDDTAMQIWRALFTPFRAELLRATAGLHFFHQLDNDFERLNFLIDEVEKGNDADALLDYIGADRAYWDYFIGVYRASGRAAAIQALEAHLISR